MAVVTEHGDSHFKSKKERMCKCLQLSMLQMSSDQAVTTERGRSTTCSTHAATEASRGRAKGRSPSASRKSP